MRCTSSPVSIPLWTLLVLYSICQSVVCQGIADDSINIPSAAGWADLKSCAHTCLTCADMGCYHNSVLSTSGCATNKCLCSPSHLWNALDFAYSCTLDSCKDYGDAQLAKDLVQGYCAARGYTSVQAPVTVEATSQGVSTVTITQYLPGPTVTKTSCGSVSAISYRLHGVFNGALKPGLIT